ncbi:hypothetical protein PMN64_12655 [Bradyrhizobium sp. UFLA01-814]|uniref:hypothetical protein n=1 Tax=Bradyrhizobium sp. UFLA01-814 TaxID=3023480 RepID=UPI00398B94D5
MKQIMSGVGNADGCVLIEESIGAFPMAELLIAIKHRARELLNFWQSKVAASSAQVGPLASPRYD